MTAGDNVPFANEPFGSRSNGWALTMQLELQDLAHCGGMLHKLPSSSATTREKAASGPIFFFFFVML